MGVLSVRELNNNVSKALARVEAGEIIEITRNGKAIAEVVPKQRKRNDDPEWRANFERLMDIFEHGLPLGGPATYEDRTS